MIIQNFLSCYSAFQKYYPAFMRSNYLLLKKKKKKTIRFLKWMYIVLNKKETIRFLKWMYTVLNKEETVRYLKWMYLVLRKKGDGVDKRCPNQDEIKKKKKREEGRW